ncbi:MAG: radical SAM protein [Nitrospirota bacterium]|jgi:radical SAM protein with 4Fe4S-binding SPASM domain
MRYFLSGRCALKKLERPSLYGIATDELYELDEEAFGLLERCASPEGCEVPEASAEFAGYCVSEGILTPEATKARRPPLEDAPEPSLRYLELQITRRCNLRCRHCYIGPPEDRELSTEDVEAVLGEFEAMQGLRAIITGGEPLLHRDFGGINALLPRYALRKILVTNGTLLTPEALRGLNFDEIQVSVDGLREAHDAIRGRGAFEKAMSSVTEALAAGLDVSVSTMVHPKNLGDFDELAETFGAMGVKDWAVDVPCPEGNLRGNPDLSLPPEKAGGYLRYGWGQGLHGGADSEAHACGLHLMSVMADGGCARCAFYAGRPVGHISEGLRQCWKRIRPTRLDELECDCDMLGICRGGCRYRAELSGDALGKDFYRCRFFGKL